MDFSIRKRARDKLTDILPQVPWFCASFCVFVGLQISRKLVDEQLTSNCQQLPKDKYTTKLHTVRWSGRKIFQTMGNETDKGSQTNSTKYTDLLAFTHQDGFFQIQLEQNQLLFQTFSATNSTQTLHRKL